MASIAVTKNTTFDPSTYTPPPEDREDVPEFIDINDLYLRTPKLQPQSPTLKLLHVQEEPIDLSRKLPTPPVEPVDDDVIFVGIYPANAPKADGRCSKKNQRREKCFNGRNARETYGSRGDKQEENASRKKKSSQVNCEFANRKRTKDAPGSKDDRVAFPDVDLSFCVGESMHLMLEYAASLGSFNEILRERDSERPFRKRGRKCKNGLKKAFVRMAGGDGGQQNLQKAYDMFYDTCRLYCMTNQVTEKKLTTYVEKLGAGDVEAFLRQGGD